MKRIQKPKLEKPIINGSVDEWGYILNDNIDKTTAFIDEVIQDSTEKENELSRLDQEKIGRDELPTFVKNTVDNYIETEVKPNLNNALDEHVENVNKPDLDSYTAQKKKELDTHEKLKETELNSFTDVKKEDLNSHVETVNKPELTRFTETQKPIIQGYTNEGKQAISEHTDLKKGELDSYTVDKKEEITQHTDSMKQELTEKTNLDKGILDAYTTEKKGEITAHTNAKLGELDTKTEENKGILDTYEKTKEQEILYFVDTTIKPDITAHADSEKNKSTTAITSHTDAEIERLNTSTDLDKKLDKGSYIGTAQDLKSDIDGKVSKSDIVNDLVTGGTDKVLSAETGKNLEVSVSKKFNKRTSQGSPQSPVDLNTLKKDGIFYGYNWRNGAYSNISTVDVKEYSPHWVTQKQIDIANGTEYFRNFYNGTTWSNWYKYWTSKNFDPNTKLDKSGGDVSGIIQIKKHNPYIYFDDTRTPNQPRGFVGFGSGEGIFQLANGRSGYSVNLYPNGDLKYNQSKIYHEGFKPVPYDIGAFSTNKPQLQNVNLNSVVESGAYQVGAGTTNVAPVGIYGTLLVAKNTGSDTIMQMYSDYDSSRTFIRTANGIWNDSGEAGNWRDWKEVFTTGNCHMQKSDNGYTKLPNGLVMQWGRSYLDNPRDWKNNVFPIAFPNKLFTVTCTPICPTVHAQSPVVQVRYDSNNTSFLWYIPNATSAWSVYWIAIGY